MIWNKSSVSEQGGPGVNAPLEIEFTTKRRKIEAAKCNLSKGIFFTVILKRD